MAVVVTVHNMWLDCYFVLEVFAALGSVASTLATRLGSTFGRKGQRCFLGRFTMAAVLFFVSASPTQMT